MPVEHIIFISEILNEDRCGEASVEIVATADAVYEFTERKVSVALECFVRRISPSGNGEHLPMPWLPSPERVEEHLARSEAADFARDVFHSWTRKVRDSIPHELTV